MKVNRRKWTIIMLLTCVVLIVGCQSNNQGAKEDTNINQSSNSNPNPNPNQDSSKDSSINPSEKTSSSTNSKSSSKPVSNSNQNQPSNTIVTNTPENKGTSAQQELKGVDFFVGDWGIWIPGGYATTETTANGDGTTTVTQEYIAGAKGNVLSIQSDQTYRWETPTEVITGNWEETTNDRIVLLVGQYEFDWYVEKTGDNEIKYYSFGMEEYGTRIQK